MEDGMKKLAMAVGIAVLAVVLSAGAVFAGGKLSVVIDRGIESSFTDKQVKNRNQCGEFMEKDLLNVLEIAGIDAELIKSKADYKAGEGTHLLVVRIKEYNPGSAAARIMVGFGAGATSMKTRYELFGSGTTPLVAEDLGLGSSIDWRKVIRKLDEQTVDGVRGKLK
jgi:hypothetical protein